MRRLSSVLQLGQPAESDALIAGPTRLTYGDVRDAVSHFATRLRQEGVRGGDKVVLTLPNAVTLPLAMMAVSELDAVAIPLNASMPQIERTRILAVAEPHFEVSGAGDAMDALVINAHGTARIEDAELNDVSLIIFTSGTTGAPKGVLLTGEALLLNAESVVDYLRLTPRDRTLIFLPLYYSYPLSQLLTTWMTGGVVVLMKNLMFPAEALQAMEDHAITGFGGVPTSLNILSSHAAPSPRSLRYVMSAGGPLPSVLIDKVAAAFPGAALFNNYGCTEIAPRATAVNYAEHPERVGSIGCAISVVDVRLIRADLSEADAGETAEIVLNGPTLMRGYYRDPQTTARRMTRWGFHTGDYAHRDADGYLYFDGRADDVFKVNGEKVSAREIEDVLLQHPDVSEVAVVAEADQLRGQVPVAYVVQAVNADATPRALQMFCRSRLSAHKVPQAVHFVPHLDRTANGKIQKFRLKSAVQGASL
jgi:acyl-CoA synthetase (AMP-forming)/AMP-acid ligase II